MNFEELYNTTFKNIYRFFYYKGVNPSAIEDLTHDVFIRFYQKYNNKALDPVESKKILFGISRNLYKEWVRQSMKEKRSEFDEQFIQIEGDSLDDYDENVYEHRVEKQKQQLKKAILQLNPKIRMVLEYRFFHNMSRKEIAEKLNIGEKDVHTYQKRGIKYLHKIIGKNNEMV